MSRPRVSVLIPSYNYARFLPEAVDSVLEQSFDDYEILIVDDASTDDSAAVIRSYAGRDPRIRQRINARNRGMVRNWNDCIEMARGDYVKFLFADDKLAHPDALKTMVERIESDDSVRLVGSARLIMDEDSRIVDRWSYDSREQIRPGRQVIADCLSGRKNLIGEPTAVLFRKADGVRGFDVRYRQLVDLELWLHLMESGDFAYVAEPCCCFRKHDSQQTALNRKEKAGEKEHFRLFDKYAGRLPGLDTDRILFVNAYKLGKLPRRDAEMQAILARLRDKLGHRFYLEYARYKLTRPFENLVRSLSGRRRRREAVAAARRPGRLTIDPTSRERR